MKDTTKVIDGSDNPTETMLKNAQNAGFAESEVEILTEEEYQIRKDAEPVPPTQPSEAERIEALEDTILFLLGGM